MKSIDAVCLRFCSFRLSLSCGLLIAATLAVGGQPAKGPTDAEQEHSLTHVTTDKPVYRVGETLYVRAVVLSGNTHVPLKPGGANANRVAQIEIKDSSGNTVTSGLAKITDSTAVLTWRIPANQAGGEYRVRVTHPMSGDAPAERRFDIRNYRAPRLRSQIAFLRDGYGPGDRVVANLHVDRAEGGVPSGTSVSVVARVDSEEIWKSETTMDSVGNASAGFNLPAMIARGEGTLAMTFQDGGTVETAAKTIPIVLETLDLAIYPEGGDLIAGLPNRVYFEGRTLNRKPADMAGLVLDAAGHQVATFRTEHEGRGRFTFTPENGAAYSLHVTEPAGIRTIFPLPPVQKSGVVIAATSDATLRRRPVVVRVTATATGSYGVALNKRGTQLAYESLWLTANEPTEVTLAVPQFADGVLVATIYDNNRTPVAERLVFRQPDRGLHIKVTTDQKNFVPGDKVTLRVTTTDDDGMPAGAMVGLTVTDATVLEMIDKREQAPRLPAMALLENDVQDLADAHVYLDENNPNGPLAIDLLLGTQGWRRFATVDAIGFVSAHGDAARRVLAATTATLAASALRNVQGSGSHLLMGVVAEAGTKIALPGVTVKVTNRDTGVTHRMWTNESGSYAFLVTPGKYSIRTEFAYFKNAVIEGIRFGGAGSTRLDLALELGAIDQQMVVVRTSRNGFDRDTTPRPDRAPKNEVELQSLSMESGQSFERLTTLLTGHPAGAVREQRDRAPENSVSSNTILNPDLIDEIRLILGSENEASRRKYERQYAHSRRSGWTAGSRTDFADTVYWNAGVRTSPSSGQATVSFELSDSVTSFRVLADGFTSDGSLGSAIGTLESKRPFSIDPKIPLEITSGDVIQMPVAMVNGLDRNLRSVNISGEATADGRRLSEIRIASAALRPNDRDRRLLPIEIGHEFSGVADLRVEAIAGSYRDTVARKVTVKPRGFPSDLSTGGVLEAQGTTSFDFILPADTVRGSVSSSVVLYPTPLASMTEALQALLLQPSGCFEQISSTSYPMVMAQQYFLTHSGVDPRIIEKAKRLLDDTYKRLRGFESRSGGYEWYGADPGHEALTAYGLLQFTDMSKTREVDPQMLQRTRSWLLSRRNDEGGFQQDSRGFGAIGSAPAETANTYITWALVESGVTGLEKQISYVKTLAESSSDNYIVALGANILQATGDAAGARQLMNKLATAQDAAGIVKGGVTSITRSGGNALAIETTALALVAWIREPAYSDNVEKAVRWIAGTNQNGRFGSTQSTVLALRAIVAYDGVYGRPKAPGRILLSVDGKTIGAPIGFTPNTQSVIVMPDVGRELSPGKHTIVLRMEGGSRMPFAMALKYHSVVPDSAPESRIGIQVVLKDRDLREGGVTEAVVHMTSKRDQPLPSPVAIVGIPGGLEVRHDQLKELIKSGRIDAYEVIGREVILYWRAIEAAATFEVPLSLIAAVPGSYTGPASRAYLYYTDEYKHWAPGLTVNIAPR